MFYFLSQHIALDFDLRHIAAPFGHTTAGVQHLIVWPGLNNCREMPIFTAACVRA